MPRQNRPAPPTVTEQLVPVMLGAVTSLNEGLAQLERGAASRNAIARKGANYTPVPAGAGPVSFSAGVLAGWSIAETSGTDPVTLTLTDGPDGPVIAVQQLPAGASVTVWLLPAGVGYTHGLTATTTGTGTLTGSIYTNPIR